MLAPRGCCLAVITAAQVLSAPKRAEMAWRARLGSQPNGLGRPPLSRREPAPPEEGELPPPGWTQTPLFQEVEKMKSVVAQIAMENAALRVLLPKMQADLREVKEEIAALAARIEEEPPLRERDDNILREAHEELAAKVERDDRAMAERHARAQASHTVALSEAIAALEPRIEAIEPRLMALVQSQAVEIERRHDAQCAALAESEVATRSSIVDVEATAEAGRQALAVRLEEEAVAVREVAESDRRAHAERVSTTAARVEEVNERAEARVTAHSEKLQVPTSPSATYTPIPRLRLASSPIPTPPMPAPDTHTHRRPSRRSLAQWSAKSPSRCRASCASRSG